MFSGATAGVPGDAVRTIRGPRTRHNMVALRPSSKVGVNIQSFTFSFVKLGNKKSAAAEPYPNHITIHFVTQFLVIRCPKIVIICINDFMSIITFN